MEQILSSPQGCSEWEVSGKGEWKSDQDSLGFFIVDKDNSSVKDSTDEIFQDNTINLNDLFWASRYSGQSYQWGNNLECVCPDWETPPPHTKDEDYPGSSGNVVGDLINFSSTSTPSSPEQTPTNLLEVSIDEKTFLQESHLVLEDTDLTNCEFNHNSLVKRRFVNEESQISSSHGTNPIVKSEGLLAVSPPTCKHNYLSSTTLLHESTTSVTCGESSLMQCYEDGASLPLDEKEISSPIGLLAGGLCSEQENSTPSAINKTIDNELQSLGITETTEETTLLISEEETICTRPESWISSEPYNETLHDSHTECNSDRELETEGNPLAVTSIDPLIDLGRIESTLALNTTEDYALLDLSPESYTCPKDHSQSTSTTDAKALFALACGQDIFADMFDVGALTSCEAVQSSNSCKPVMSPEIDDSQPTTQPNQQSNASSPDFKIHNKVHNITDAVTVSPDSVPEAMEKQRTGDSTTTEDPHSVTQTNIFSDLNQNQEETALRGKSNDFEVNFQVCNDNLDLKACILDDHKELNRLNQAFQEEITAQKITDNTPVENLKPADQLTSNSSTIVKVPLEEDTTPHHDNHDSMSNNEEKFHSVSLHEEEITDCRMSIHNQVILQCASNPDSPEFTPFTCAGDQLTMMGGLVGWDQEVPSKLSEGEAELPSQPTHQDDFHQVILSQPDLPQEQQVSSVSLSSPSRNVFPCGAGLDGEAYLTLMEKTPDTQEMTLGLCKASEALHNDSFHDQRVTSDLINVPIVSVLARGDEEHSALRAVFQALDQDGDGFVHIEEFMEFAKAYGAEQVKDLTRFLDPSGLGVISFEDFHRGISAISGEGSDPDLYKTRLSSVEAGGPPEEYDEAEISDSAYLGSESAYSECETFTDEDTTALVHPELHEDVETDSGIENTLTDGDDRNRFMLGSDLNGHTTVAVIGGDEEHFEDFGESNNSSDLLFANQEEGRVATEGEGDVEHLPHPDSPMPRPLMLLSPSPSSFPASFQSFLQSEALEFFCTHCHKQISRLEDLSTRLQLLEMNSSSKRLSSKKAARHLQQCSALEGMGDLNQDILDLADRDITDKVLLLEKRVCELETDSLESEEQITRLRQENLTLVHRANALEEQLKEQELHTEETLHLHTRKHRDALAKLQRERELEIENLQARLHQLDEENSELRSCVPCLRANIERLEEEKRKLQDEIDDVTERLNEEMESRRKMSDKLSHEHHTNHTEKECTQGLIEDLRKQLEHLQLFKLETEAKRGRSASCGLQEYNTHMKENELEQEIRRLKQDNRSLKEQNDELNGQIINLSIQGAKSLFTESLSESLAAEINNVSRTELMEAIHKQEEINFRLQDYIDRIIVAIMECNPSILEVK
ncbi:rab11 family-interacting protein 3 isoform X2 [Triplophysa dalaica]|uniref:rab11 family-interacting protein 3 isoform X2 n=1 Tax=Triplophysa dalaica TaxID=1582913 RepID=UPI0024E03A38|nr:rab11 family-interacting protein 3 isoform X2 [Triplophysa dalaica]